MKDEKNIIAYLALAAVCIIWGTTYLALRVGVMLFPPFLLSMIRFLSSGFILAGLTLWLGKVQRPTKEILINQAITGICMCALGVGVVGWAEMYISSGLAAIICSMMPIWVILINIFTTTDERPTLPILLGLAIGLVGIVIIFGEHLAEFSDSHYRFGILITFAANMCWAIGSVWIKRKNSTTNPFLGAGLQMFFGGLFLIPMSLLFDDYSRVQWSGELWGALAYLSLIGSVAAYACYSYAIKKLPMTMVSLYAYINPIVAVLLGWVILNERLNFRIGIGILITIAGIYIVNRGYQLRDIWKTRLERFKI